MSNVKQTSFFSARSLARAAGLSAKSVHRRAAAERWPRREIGNRYLYNPPPGFAKRRKAAKASSESGGFGDRIISEPDARLLARANFRLAAITELQRQLDSHAGREKALRDTVDAFSFQISASALRRWARQFQQLGFDGLVEHKRGVVGRRAARGRGRR